MGIVSGDIEIAIEHGKELSRLNWDGAMVNNAAYSDKSISPRIECLILFLAIRRGSLD